MLIIGAPGAPAQLQVVLSDTLLQVGQLLGVRIVEG